MDDGGDALSLEVAVIPVAVRHDGVDHRPTLMAWPAPDGHWTRHSLVGTAASTAQVALQESLPPGAAVLQAQLHPAPITFVEERRRLVLLYTAALPMALCDPAAPEADRWLPLLAPEAKASDARRIGEGMLADAPFTRSVLNHWRQALEETGAALTFLARHWTVAQLRDVYSAVWGYDQDTASFTKWALRSPGVFKPLQDKLPPNSDLTDELADALADADAFISGPTAGSASRARRPPPAANKPLWAALSRSIKPTAATGLGLVKGPLPVAIMAAAAAVVAYQTSTRGPAPTWYTTAVERPEEHQLEQVYAPRPAWLAAPG